VISVRRHRGPHWKLDDLVARDMLPAEAADFLSELIAARFDLLISGGTNAGKTTLLRALCHEVRPSERIITVERDLLELGIHLDQVQHPDCVALYSRQANTEDVGEVTVAELVRATRRMNPSRVVVGEILGDEVLALLDAASAGAYGALGSVHADSSDAVFGRLATYGLQAPERLPPSTTAHLVAQAIDFVVHVEIEEMPGRPAARYVSSIREVTGLADDGRVASSEVWAIGPDGRLAPHAPLSARRARIVARRAEQRMTQPGRARSGHEAGR